MANSSEWQAQLAASVATQAQLQRERRRRLLGEYGPDRWPRGAVLIFRPHLDEKDQETRAAVKIGSATWTLTARGGTHTWGELLELAGEGHVLKAAADEKAVRLIVVVAESLEE